MEKKKPIPARRKALKACNNGGRGHAGLLLGRYLDKLNDSESKEALQKAAIDAISATSAFYKNAFLRRQNMYEDQYRKEAKTQDNNRLIIGLGNASVLETGLTLHHTYGVPIIPGSALKGLCAHHARELFFEWCAENKKWKEKDTAPFNEAQYAYIFGSDEKESRSRGNIIFHDAWITPDSLSGSLKADVMTPHHTDYYNQKGESAPTDFDSPNPVSFLSVSGTFEIILSPSSTDGKNWLAVVWAILKDALETRGIGGKTSSGYGRMTIAKDENLEKKPTCAAC